LAVLPAAATVVVEVAEGIVVSVTIEEDGKEE